MQVINVNKNPERDAMLNAILPMVPLTTEISDKIDAIYFEHLAEVMAQAVIAEVEIFRAIPKANSKFNIETFNPTTNGNCFMGQGFFSNGDWIDADLVLYRKRVGTIEHSIWGNCTLLEIWGAEHFTDYPDMVRDVFNYASGETSVPGVVEVKVNMIRHSSKVDALSSNYEDRKEAFQKAQFFDMGLKQSDYRKWLREESKEEE